ncbi:MAG: acyl-CoA dehydrogenase, partial [Acidimicrobiia bacterium]|nr:acyl-CoA dehydrogenase [Acidimicrobiia bacterium]
MHTYRPPLWDFRFVLENIVGLDELATFPGWEHADADLVSGALEEAGKFFSEVWAPTSAEGDTSGATWDNGDVHLPKSHVEAWHMMTEAGWQALPFDETYGGGGMPWSVHTAVAEMMIAANKSLSMLPGLTQGAIDLIDTHGSEEQKETYLPRLVAGEWSGTMNLTEPEAGSDVGALRTRAERQADGTYRIFGTKIFISFGEHDGAENIIHMVLARTPDAPAGTKGISCFIVPKYLVNADGSLGERNDVQCLSIEHKMGIKASPTCVLSYGEDGGAVGHLVGEENRGMRYMFTMMNAARLAVAVEGAALGELALQQAVSFARERVQGKPIGAV